MESWYVTAVLNQCPACHQADLFVGFLKLRETCPVCGVRFERWAGSWTGPTVGGYGVGSVVGVVLGFVLWRRGLLVPGAEWIIALVACGTVLLVMRPIKAAWIGLLFDWGYVFADADLKRSEMEPDPAPRE